MKKILNIALIGTLLISSCSQKQGENEMDSEVVTSNNEPDEVVAASMDITSISTGYLAVKEALVQTDAEKAKATAKQFITVLDGDGEMVSKMKESAQAIADAQEVEAQRAAFELLSESMYHYAQSNNVERGTLYKQYCPMAFGNIGAYWLSASKEIRNPYFGDKMLKCGSVQETLE